jgi:hypothetical protein
MRLLSSVMALALAGCALEIALPPAADDLIREPNYRAIVAASIGSIVGNPNNIGGTEISGARRTDSFKGPAWLVCLKSDVYRIPKYHAAFIQNDRLVDSRFAVTLDQCEAQPYTPFDWKPKPVAEDDDRKPARGRR